MATMDSLEQRAERAPEIPRFDDGMASIRELIRIMAESLVNEIMDAQAEDACADGNQRNGYRELKRRSHVVQVFPSRKSLIRMPGAVFAEMDEGWQSRRWLAEDSIAQAYGGWANAPEPSYDGSPEEQARRIIGLVMADNPIPRKAA